ncbi:uncharacterized protein EV420DRAFT_1472594 [Desarmillaria tabescens]|uniref:Uncharacterized protein n=1 Tax=Armillaria tabescens TaxID=1929756 RepID=A0AA39TT37_ARMTA|nr:uncharacterized protein EV420DRAFT_1472594 [Desarmillaria tabescens]KAK0469347.1 hypothetical protein EV420DRAFT_1472594 [Desarmillaria tabescens]
MRFSVVAFIPLAVLVGPALSGTVQTRGDYDGKVDYNDKYHKDNDREFGDHKDDRGWKNGKYTPYSTGFIKKDTFEIDCKKHGCKDDYKCHTCQIYSEEEEAEEFIKYYDDKYDGKHDDKYGRKYYDSSCWNVYY